MNKTKKWINGIGMLLMVGLTLSAATMHKESKSFGGKKTVRLDMVSGDCVIKAGSGNKIEVNVSYDYDKDEFTPKFEEQGDTLRLGEDFSGGNCSGHSSWEVTLPANTAIEFRSASGDLQANGGKNGLSAKSASGEIKVQDFAGEVELNTASGDIDLRNISGEIEVHSASGEIRAEGLSGKTIKCQAASGDIDLRTISGGLAVSCASGNIQAEGMTLEGTSSFKAASGDVSIKLAAALKSDITVASASGDATLDFNGQDMVGSFELSAKKGRSIVAPFKFDKEEEIEKHGQTYIKKTAQRKSSTPLVTVKSASGKAEVK